MDDTKASFDLFYTDSGGNGVPVVFVHGFPFDHAMWAPQVEALTPQFRVITYDLRGHGKSPLANDPYPFEFFVDDFFALLSKLQLRSVIACGLSMGGYILLRAFEREPGLFKGLILSDTRSEADTNEAKIKRSLNIKVIYEKGVSTFSEGFLKSAFAPQTFDQQPAVVDGIRRTILSTAPRALATALLAMASRTDTTTVLSSIKIPVLTLAGEVDPITPPAVVEAMSRQIPNAIYHTIPGAAHLSNLENPEVFNKHMLDFLKPWAKV